MGKQQEEQPIHRHEELLQAFSSRSSGGTNGFAVNIDQSVREEHFTDVYFRSDYMVICLISSGEISLTVNLKQYDLTTNGLIVVAPNALKQLLNASSSARLSIVSFTGDFLNRVGMPNVSPELFEYFSTKFSPYWVLDQESADILRDQMFQLYRRNNAVGIHPFGKELLYSSFQTFMYEIAGISQLYSEPVNNYVSRKENLMMEFFQLVQKNFKRQRTVRAYAEMLHITPKYLTETIKEISGQNAGEIIDDVVMLEARYLLGNPTLSIGEVANMLNFNDQSFFGKFFKRHAGASPKEYRKAL
jgi:AraC family transcriptional activator of pobA